MKSICNFKYVILSLFLGWSAMSAPASAQSSSLVSSSPASAQTSWREIFLDAQLRALIEQGLERNTDLNVARLRIDQAEASLKSARLANLPSLAFSPTAGISTFGGSQAVKTYSLPLQASWQVDIFGRLKNAKMQQKMLVESSKAYREAVEVQVIASIAREYYTCALLNAQLSLANQSVSLWDETVRAMKAFMQEGQYTDAAVSQAEASREEVKTTALDLQQQIRESENAIRVLVGDSLNELRLTLGNQRIQGEKLSAEDSSMNQRKETITSNQRKKVLGVNQVEDEADLAETSRSSKHSQQRSLASRAYDFSRQINLDATQGIPLQRLSARPDVRQAEMNLSAALYATKEAKAAFYPSLTLSGTAGWTNSSGMIVNPGKMLFEAIASLTQPIFQNGRLKADLAIKKSQQEEARLQFQQALLNAGVEVNNALTHVQTYSDKSSLLDNQVKSLERTVKSTRLLQQNGSSNYLEVLTAQENLLSAQMSRLQNQYNKVAALIALYQATM